MNDVNRARSATLAIAAAAALVLYVALNVRFYWDGFFRHWGAPLTLSLNAVYLEIAPDRFSIVPWSRFPIFAATCAALGWCAAAWWRGAAMARIGSCFVFYGLLAPQGSFLYLYLTDFGVLPRLPALLVSVALAILPALVLGAPSVFSGLTERERHLAWARLPFGRARLFAAGLFAAWLFFASEAYLSRWDFIPNRVGLVAAWLSLLAGPATLFGLLRLRTWSVLTLLLLAALIGVELPCVVAGGLGFALAPVPLVIAGALTAPFLRAARARLQAP